MRHEAYEWVYTDTKDVSAATRFLKALNIELCFMRALREYKDSIR